MIGPREIAKARDLAETIYNMSGDDNVRVMAALTLLVHTVCMSSKSTEEAINKMLVAGEGVSKMIEQSFASRQSVH